MVSFLSRLYARLLVPLGVAAAIFVVFPRARWAHPVGALMAIALGVYEFCVSDYRWSHFWMNKHLTWANFRRFAFRDAVLALGPALLAILVYTIIHAPYPPGQDRLPAKARAWLNAHKPWGPVGVPIGCLVGTELLVAFSLTAVERRGTVIRRGRVVHSQEEAARTADRSCKQLEEQTGREDRGLSWGGIRLPSPAGRLSFFLFGAQESGKSALMALLMQDALAGIGKGGRKVRALINDWKRDQISVLAGMGIPFKILNCMDARCVAWDMAKDLTDGTLCKAAAAILLPTPQNSNQQESFFTEAARNLMGAVMTAFAEFRPGNWSFNDVVYALRRKERLTAVLDLTPDGRDFKELYFSKEKTALDVMATIANATNELMEVAGAWENAREMISLMDWVRGEYVLVLGTSHTAKPLFKKLNSVIVHRLAQLLLEHVPQDGSGDTWIFLDELSQLGNLGEPLKSLAREGRSRNIALVLGTQEKEGLDQEYGEKTASEIVGLCANLAFLRLSSHKTAEMCSATIGDSEIAEDKNSTTRGPGGDSSTESREVTVRRVVLPSQLLNFPAVEIVGGIPGWFLSPYISEQGQSGQVEAVAWRAFISLHHLRASIAKPNPLVPNFIKRPAHEMKLRPWSIADTQRLGLPASLAGPRDGDQITAVSRAEDKVVSLPPRRRVKDLGCSAQPTIRPTGTGDDA
jgi:hypothetical protein